MKHGHETVCDTLRAAGGALLIKESQLAQMMCELAKTGTPEALADLERLLRNGALATAREYDDRTALHLAASMGHADFCTLLRAHGADRYATDRWDHTPIDEAKSHGFDALAAALEE